MPHLHINVDHIATVRQARKTHEPDPVYAAMLAEQAGAQGITMHLREDRRHIQDRDIRLMRQMGQTPLNLEMAVTDEMVQFALEVLPPLICLVPEKREEVTTEGGLEVAGNFVAVQRAVSVLQAAGMEVSLFIGPVYEQIKAAAETGAKAIELHTGEYAHAQTAQERRTQLDRLSQGVQWGLEGGLKVNAGHGLTYFNIGPVAALKGLSELNIGHSVISRSLYVGIPQAVKEMLTLIEKHSQG